MKNKKATVYLIVLCLLLVAPLQAGWEELADPPKQVGAELGSALCAGAGNGRNYVWFLQNGAQADFFCRYDINQNRWEEDPQSPPFSPGLGAALAYVPNLDASPASGWVFALRGDNTKEFWFFDGDWHRAPDIPDSVVEGGALCYGGVQELWGREYYVLYAFSGQDYEVGGEPCGRFWRYHFPRTPHEPEAPLDGSWTDMPDIPGMTHRYFPALVWLPMNDRQHYPMGLVVAMKNYQEKGHFHLYYPDRNTWYDGCDIPHPFRPGKYAKLSDGACMTSHYRDSTIFLLGEIDRYFGFYDVVNNAVYYPDDTTSEPVRGGAAITALHWEGIAYAEFGTQTLVPSGPNFYRWVPPPEQEGKQGLGISLLSEVKVGVRSTQTFHIFSVKCAPGPVKLSIMDVTGRKIASLSAQCYNGDVDITYNHPIIKSGVYFWKASTASGDANGKLVIAK
ncbi:MAG: hypothetical protein ABIK39_06065 [candidate division WOR-3 bacterium]